MHCPPTGAFRMVKSSDESFFKLYLVNCYIIPQKNKEKFYRTVPIAQGKQKWDITAGCCFCCIENSFMFLMQTPQNQRSLSELVRGKQFAETMRIGIVLCRKLRRGAHYALPSGWQAQTKCVRFCESLRSLRETNYQSIECSPLKQVYVI